MENILWFAECVAGIALMLFSAAVFMYFAFAVSFWGLDCLVNVFWPVIRGRVKKHKPKSPLVYLACPYTSKYDHIQAFRFMMVSYYAAELLNRGEAVYSPVTYSHPLSLWKFGARLDWAGWMRHCMVMLSKADKMIVYKLAGWEESKGLQAEIAEAKRLGIPIEFVQPEERLPELIGESR